MSMSQARLPAWALATSTLLLFMGFETFIFGVLVLIPSVMAAEYIGSLIGNVQAARMAIASAWIIGYALYTIQKVKHRAWLPILVFTITTVILFNADVSPLVAEIGAIAYFLAESLKSLIGAGNGLVAALIAALAYSIIISWITRAIGRGGMSLLMSSVVATVLGEAVSILTIALVGELLTGGQLEQSMSNYAYMAVLLLVVISMLKDAADALRNWDPSLLAQLPIALLIASALFKDITRVFAALALALTAFGVGGGLAMRSKKLLVTASVLIGAFGVLAAVGFKMGP